MRDDFSVCVVRGAQFLEASDELTSGEAVRYAERLFDIVGPGPRIEVRDFCDKTVYGYDERGRMLMPDAIREDGKVVLAMRDTRFMHELPQEIKEAIPYDLSDDAWNSRFCDVVECVGGSCFGEAAGFWIDVLNNWHSR